MTLSFVVILKLSSGFGAREGGGDPRKAPILNVGHQNLNVSVIQGDVFNGMAVLVMSFFLETRNSYYMEKKLYHSRGCR